MSNTYAKEGKSKLNNFIVQGGILAFAGVLARMLGLIKRVPLAYIIGDVGNSYFSSAYDIYNIFYTVAVFGIPTAVSKLVSARVSKGQYRNADKIFKCTMVFAFITGLISSVTVFVFANQLSLLFKEPMSFLALRVLAPTLFVVSIMAVFRGYFQGLGTMVPTAISQLLEQIVLVAVSLTSAYFLTQKGEKVGLILHNENYKNAYGAAGATLGCLVGASVGLVFFLLLYRSHKRKFVRKVMADPNHTIETTGYVFKTLILTIIPIVISSTVNNLSNIIDHTLHNNVMVAKGLESVMSVNWGIYSGKYSVLISVPIAIAAAMGASSVPTISGIMRRKEYVLATEKIASVIRVTMMIAIPCAVGMAVMSREIMYMLFSIDNDLASNLLRIGAAGIVLFSLSTLTNGILQGMGYLVKPIKHGLIALLFHVIIEYGLLMFTDLNTYAIALSNNFFSLFICVMNLFSISRILSYRQEYKKTFLLPMASSAVMGGVLIVLNILFYKNGFSRILIVVEILIGMIVYFAGLLLTKCVTAYELKAIPGGKVVYKVLHTFHIM